MTSTSTLGQANRSAPQVDQPDSNYIAFKAVREKIPCVLPDLGHAVRISAVDVLNGVPYPIVFRNQGALDEWRHLYDASEIGKSVWQRLSDTEGTYTECMHEVHWQFERHLGPRLSRDSLVDRFDLLRANAIQWAANISYERKRGALIETTQALDTLLLHSDLDDDLPMRFLAPPYPAQYLKLNREVAGQLATAEDRMEQRWIDGVFCFYTAAASPKGREDDARFLEIVIVYNNNEKGIGTQTLLGPIKSPGQTVEDWVNVIFGAQYGQPAEADDIRIRLISYMAKVFLYLGLRDARKELCTDYSTALRRLSAVGPKKHAKLQRRLDALYDRVTVGPTSLPPSATTGDCAGQLTPHWRRGHFRLQVCGLARKERKLIFVAPVLVRADKLHEAPRPKNYALNAGCAKV